MEGQVIVGIGALVLGAIVGSFLNALSFRYNTGRGVIWARSTSLRASRSRCMHCGHELAVADLIPIVSFLNLRGRCRYCATRLSLQYPLVEGTSALVAVLVYFNHPEPLPFFFWFLAIELLASTYSFSLGTPQNSLGIPCSSGG